ncbi:MAG: DoxX family protein [Patescibacteria group bacterium]
MTLKKEKLLFSLFVTRPAWGMIPARIMFGTILFLHGLQRLLMIRADAGTFLGELPGAAAFVILLMFSIVELLGGALIIPGFLSRIVGFTVIIEMIFSIFTERIPVGFVGDVRLEMLLFSIAAMILFSGPGRFSVDRWIARKLLAKYPSKKWEHYVIAETPHCEHWYE